MLRVGYLYREGDSAYDFFVVLTGLVDIFITADGQERQIASHGPAVSSGS